MLSSLPYIVGYRAQTEEMVFSGAVFNRLDVDVHLASMQAGAAGDWTYQLRFTSEPHRGIYAKLTYVLLGHAARALRLSIPAAYQIFRLLFGLLACVGIYALMAQVFPDLFWRRLAFLWAVLGSGLGWLQLLAGWLPVADISPIDFWLIDPYPFFGMLVFPHFSLVTALLAGMLALFLSHLRLPAWWKVGLIALFAVLAQLAQSYVPLLADLALLGAALAVMLRKRRVARGVIASLGVIALAQMPLAIYGLGLFWHDLFWAEFSRQNVTLSPPPLYYLGGMAFFWPFALAGWAGWLRKKASTARETLAAALGGSLLWVAATLLLAYLPWNLQRRFTHALTLPLTLPATFSMMQLELRKTLPARRLALGVVALSTISSLYLAAGFTLVVSSRPPDLYDPAALAAAVDWLGERAAPGGVVLSAPRSGQLLAARGGVLAYIGHPIETLEYERKLAAVTAYYGGETSWSDLPACGCDWLLIGPYERDLGGEGFAPRVEGEPVYRAGDVAIYRLEGK